MFAAIAQFLGRPGVQTSEHTYLVAASIWLGTNLGENWVPVWQALIPVVPAVVYAVARGLAKTETRGTTTGGA